MRIAVEIGWGHKAGGARRVAAKTLLEMIQLRPDYKYFVYSNTRHPELNKPGIRQIELSAPNFVPRVLWDQIIFPHLTVPFEVLRLKPDVIHYTNNLVSCWNSSPAVVTIHDMTPFVIPRSFNSMHAFYQRAYFRFAAKHAVKIITVSENSKKDICRLLSVDEKKVIVAPLAADLTGMSAASDPASIDLESRFGIKGSFILYVGAIHPRKNVRRILEAFAVLKKDRKIPHQLVIVGELRWMATNLFGTSTFDALKDQIVFTGRVSDTELVTLYKKCNVFVWPSIYEGFGLPVLEAMSLGAPVVTSNCSSLPEVTGDAAILVDPYSVEEISQAIWKVIDNAQFADELRKKGFKRAAKFSWKITAQKVLEVLESVA